LDALVQRFRTDSSLSGTDGNLRYLDKNLRIPLVESLGDNPAPPADLRCYSIRLILLDTRLARSREQFLVQLFRLTQFFTQILDIPLQSIGLFKERIVGDVVGWGRGLIRDT